MEAGKTSQKRVTLRDVAQEAGVSLKTASNVINGTGRMGDATRQKVKKVVQRFDYRVNVAARNLNRGKTGAVTLAVPTLTAPYLAELANRIIDEARQRNIPSVCRHIWRRVGEGRTKAPGIIQPHRMRRHDLLHERGRRHHPRRPRRGLPARCGRRPHHIAVVGAHRPYDETQLAQAVEGNAELRLRGIIQAHLEQGLTPDPALVGVTGQDWTIGAGAKTTQQLIDSGMPFDSIIALNDQLAIGAVSALTASGINIPNQVQVIGFDNIEEAAYLQIPLTTMDSCLEWVSRSAVDCILRRIQGEDLPHELIRCLSHVIARQTTR